MAVDKLVDSSALDTKLTQVANAIRGKTGDSASLAFPGGFVDAVGELTNVEDTTATAGDVLSGKNFYNASGVKTQGNIASKSSSDLKINGETVTAPAGYYASNASIQLNDVVTGVDLSQISRLTYVNRVGIVGNNAFIDTALTTVSFPSATSIGESAFFDCSSLTSVSLPSATSIGVSAFRNCSSLTSVSLPSATSIGMMAFYHCIKLNSLSLPSVTSIGQRAFESCYMLDTVILGANQVCSLASSAGIFIGTIFYVPDNLVNSYKSATNWSNIASQIKPMSQAPTV